MAASRGYLKNWILPTVTTFIGVFAGTYLTVWSEDVREDANRLMLLEVAITDACSALVTAERVHRQLSEGTPVGAVTAIHEPKILMAVLQDHATAFAEFHRPISREVITLLAIIGTDIPRFARDMEAAQNMSRIAPFIMEGRDDQSAQIIGGEAERMLDKTTASAGELERALSRLALLLELQLGLSRDEFPVHEADQQLAGDSSTPRCLE